MRDSSNGLELGNGQEMWTGELLQSKQIPWRSRLGKHEEMAGVGCNCELLMWSPWWCLRHLLRGTMEREAASLFFPHLQGAVFSHSESLTVDPLFGLLSSSTIPRFTSFPSGWQSSWRKKGKKLTSVSNQRLLWLYRQAQWISEETVTVMM